MARVVGRPTLVLATIAAIASGAAVLAACSRFGAAEPEPVPEAGIGADAGTCASGAFCDSFDDGQPLPRAWKQVATLEGATLAIVADAGLGSSSALVATILNNGKDQTASLEFEVGQKGPTAYDVVLVFSARLTTTNAGLVLGPLLYADVPDSGLRALIIGWHDGKIRLDRYIPSCDGGCLVSKNDTPVDAGWHRYTLTVNVHSASAADYGSVKLELDKEVLDEEPLPFTLSSPSKYGIQFGVTFSSGGAGGSVAFDDVSLLVTPR